MKKLSWLLIAPALALSINAANAQEFTLSGDLKFADTPEKAYLFYSNDGKRITDSAEIVNGKFTISNDLLEPASSTLRIKFKPATPDAKPRFDMMQLFLEASNIKLVVKDSMQFAKVTGSKAHIEFDAYSKSMVPFEEKSKVLNAAYMKFRTDKDEAGMEKVVKDFDQLDVDKKAQVMKPFLAANPNSPIALYVLNLYAGYDMSPKEIEPIFNSLSSVTKQSKSGVDFAKRIEVAKKTDIGAFAMNFTQNDTLGKPVSLTDFKGKYVLLDFWASWCGPCRVENPNVVKAFKNFNEKGFTVLGISLDQPGKQEAWMKAIHKDELTWTHVSDLKFWDNEVARQYGIRAIPQNFLVDPNGKIVAKNIRGEELQTVLAKHLK